MDLQLNSVDIWNVEAIADKIRAISFIDLLSPDEIERANKYIFERDYRQYIMARGVLRFLSGKYLRVDPSKIVFHYGDYGKPKYQGSSPINFNVSHSGERTIIAFSKGLTIGADIEKIKNNFNVMELAENFFSKEEIKALKKIDKEDRQRAFYRCWTRKESFIKAVGQGLSYPLDSFAVSLTDDHNAKFLKIDGISDPTKSWQLHSFIPAEGYIGALSVKGDPKAIQFLDWHRDVQL